ncbi:PspC domain-containing protein [Thermomonospora umbrina]|uniref:Phage shock protein C (PspC) family protein n=1 Tax=Thermomonospora umbrina TaxID=111806 RepID=A0A3D9SQD1_9ACTN|nr:PspC domain-containing protein [Thermomonospora umbrina]REE96690.1 phage shock protein C (PspC) family protein [Thermomonospora umbrina]
MDNDTNTTAETTDTPITDSAAPRMKEPTRQLRRPVEGRLIGGVCAGAGDFLGVDANVVRLMLGVFTVFGGSGIALYVLGWLLIPETGRDTSIAQDVINKNRDNPKVQNTVAKTRDAFNKTMASR